MSIIRWFTKDFRPIHAILIVVAVVAAAACMAGIEQVRYRRSPEGQREALDADIAKSREIERRYHTAAASDPVAAEEKPDPFHYNSGVHHLDPTRPAPGEVWTEWHTETIEVETRPGAPVVPLKQTWRSR